ncbi:MAG: hypothetical protein NWE92_08885 [Candidatus Bathyarchaeota archaeon]|nr:hypothetical protein [Candidatus Bathyarchaeota archaeon]
MPITQTRKLLTLALATATLLLAFIVINNGVSAQTFNPQQPPLDGTMPSPGFDGGMGPGGFNGTFPDGGMGGPGGFNGTMPGGPSGDGNFTRPDFIGTPSDGTYNENNGLVSGSQPDYTLIIIIAVVAVAAAVAVVGVVLFRKKKKAKPASPPPPTDAAASTFDF